MKKGLNVVCLAYRDWAIPVIDSIKRHPRVDRMIVFRNNDHFDAYMTQQFELAVHPDVPDIVMYCGWSDEPIKRWLKYVPHVGLHCAGSDRYSAGTPLQNQIIDGLSETKHRIFKVGHPELSLRQWSHETTIDLRGSITDVFEQLMSTGKLLYNQFLDDYPNITWNTWDPVDEQFWNRKRGPNDSIIAIETVPEIGTRHLYNMCRCLEDPYPNVQIEDDDGYLIIEKVSYKAKK